MTALPKERLASARVPAWAKLAISLLVLAATLWVVDVRELWLRLRALDPLWLLAALVVCSLQFVVLAVRWWLIARWLSVPLAYRQALGEYYLSTLLNQILPLGVLGDAYRLLRHRERARRERPTEELTARVALALLLDRFSGQLGLWLVVVAVSPAWWTLAGVTTGPALLASALAVLLVLGSLAWFARRRWSGARRLLDDAARSLFGPRKLPVHLALSLLLVTMHIAVFVLVARALALELPVADALRVVPLVLVAATLPGFFAGWGIREAAAAGLYQLSGLYAIDGATVSLVSGALALIASLPGLFVWWRSSVHPE